MRKRNSLVFTSKHVSWMHFLVTVPTKRRLVGTAQHLGLSCLAPITLNPHLLQQQSSLTSRREGFKEFITNGKITLLVICHVMSKGLRDSLIAGRVRSWKCVNRQLCRYYKDTWRCVISSLPRMYDIWATSIRRLTLVTCDDEIDDHRTKCDILASFLMYVYAKFTPFLFYINI